MGGPSESRRARGQGLEPAETPLAHVSTFCGFVLARTHLLPFSYVSAEITIACTTTRTLPEVRIMYLEGRSSTLKVQTI